MKIFGPLILALIASIGNAMFAAGQKKAVLGENSLIFIALSAGLCVLLTLILSPLFGELKIGELVRANWKWIILSATGLFLTYLGFNLLYARYGTSYYILYAVISILTTAVVVGAVIFHESFNRYHLLSCLTALATVLLFSLGNRS